MGHDPQKIRGRPSFDPDIFQLKVIKMEIYCIFEGNFQDPEEGDLTHPKQQKKLPDPTLDKIFGLNLLKSVFIIISFLSINSSVLILFLIGKGITGILAQYAHLIIAYNFCLRFYSSQSTLTRYFRLLLI